METHQGYATKSGEGARCSACGEWIRPGEDCVLVKPGVVGESGHVDPAATAIHGVLHVPCLEEL